MIEAGGGTGRVGRVMWVEDNPETIADLKRLLEAAGLEVTLAETGDEAIEALTAAANEGRPYDVVILDLEYSAGQQTPERRLPRRSGRSTQTCRSRW